MTNFRQTVSQWQQDPKRFSLADWRRFIERLSPLNFASGAVEVDDALWGSFWQGDVISPGYTLPLLELAFLRAARLEKTLNYPSPESYLQSLQDALKRPPESLWLTTLLEKPALCFTKSMENSSLIIWLVDGKIAAGYQDDFLEMPGHDLILLKSARPQLNKQHLTNPFYQQQLASLPDRLPDWELDWPDSKDAAKLDILIQCHCAYSHLRRTSEGETIEAWIVRHNK